MYPQDVQNLATEAAGWTTWVGCTGATGATVGATDWIGWGLTTAWTSLKPSFPILGFGCGAAGCFLNHPATKSLTGWGPTYFTSFPPNKNQNIGAEIGIAKPIPKPVDLPNDLAVLIPTRYWK